MTQLFMQIEKYIKMQTKSILMTSLTDALDNFSIACISMDFQHKSMIPKITLFNANRFN